MFVLQYTGRQEAIVSMAHLGVAQLVARYLGVVEAASSSLVTQTSIFNEMHKKSSQIVRFRLDFLFIMSLSIRLYHSVNGLVHS